MIFPLPYFVRMTEYLHQFVGKTAKRFLYCKRKRLAAITFTGLDNRIYIDLTHPFTSFFVRPESLPAPFEEKQVGIGGMKLIKIKSINMDRVFYLVFKRKEEVRVIGVELTGKASYVLVIDASGRIIYKYPPHRQRKRGGDTGSFYEMVKSRFSPPLSKYFGDFFENMDPEKLIELFKNSKEFYTNGEIILPVERKGFRYCGDFSWCFFTKYLKERFNLSPELLKYFDETVPYYIYFKAAGLLKNGMLTHTDKLEVGGHIVRVPPFLDKNAVIEYLMHLGKLLAEDPHSEADDVRKSVFSFVSPSGFKVSVGRSAKDNNRLTFNYARGDDMFFHVRDYPGAHVILHTGGASYTDEDILFCARLAKQFSKAKKGGRVEVVYTKVKYVRPLKKSPGKVIFSKEKSVRV